MSSENRKKGVLLVVSGYSGVGKGTVISTLMKQHPEYVFSVSATTRAARPGEVDGREYFFLTRETFSEWLAEGRFLEHTTYLDRSYGTPRDYVEMRREEGHHVILDIEVEGALNVKKACPDAILVYIIPPSAEDLVKRLTGRGTETAEQVRGRLNKAVEETAVIPEYDHVIVNREVQNTADEIDALVNGTGAPLLSKAEGIALASSIREDLTAYLKKIEEHDIISRTVFTDKETTMIHPSYSELMTKINAGGTAEDPVVKSRYSIVMGTAKRARQMVDNGYMEQEDHSRKPLSIAVEELDEGRIRILSNSEYERLKAEKEAERAARYAASAEEAPEESGEAAEEAEAAAPEEAKETEQED